MMSIDNLKDVLQGVADKIMGKVEEKVDISQGASNVGKILKVNSSGNLDLADESAVTEVQLEGTVATSTTVTFTSTTYIGSGNYLLDFYCSDYARSIDSIAVSGDTVTVTYDSDITDTTNICVAKRQLV